jgi:hypothetical protein
VFWFWRINDAKTLVEKQIKGMIVKGFGGSMMQ